MIGAWRAAFADPDLAFGIISLCASGNQSEENYLERMLDAGAIAREAQSKPFELLDRQEDELAREYVGDDE